MKILTGIEEYKCGNTDKYKTHEWWSWKTQSIESNMIITFERQKCCVIIMNSAGFDTEIQFARPVARLECHLLSP